MTASKRREGSVRALGALAAWLAVAVAAEAGTLAVTGTYPPRHAARIAPSSAISLRFDRALAPATITAANVRAYGKSSGPVVWTSELLEGATLLRLWPADPFAVGETVLVNLSEAVTGVDGSPLPPGGFAFQFAIAVEPSSAALTEIANMSVRTSPNVGTRLYGAQPADVDLDGWLDLVTINEDTADARVLMNRDDGSGLFHPVLLPTSPIGFGASPNEAADFDRDGWPDIATANGAETSVSILLGHGDGSFDPELVVTVGSNPRGLAVLDVDGDADLDLAVAVYGAGNMALIENLGSGTFAPATFFDSGTGNEWGLAAGDMDEDGRVDLVVGTRTPGEIRILRNLGNGTFTPAGSRPALGNPWQLALGDVDGDGHLDVTCANGSSANGAVLLGNGDGTLDAAVTHAIVGLALATDLGDLDGDGDLDWVLSSYSGARWDMYRNDGAGSFSFWRRFDATESGSCAVFFDSDNDRDLDLALLDEEADEARILRNPGAPGTLFTDRFETGDATPWSAVAP